LQDSEGEFGLLLARKCHEGTRKVTVLEAAVTEIACLRLRNLLDRSFAIRA